LAEVPVSARRSIRCGASAEDVKVPEPVSTAAQAEEKQKPEEAKPAPPSSKGKAAMLLAAKGKGKTSVPSPAAVPAAVEETVTLPPQHTAARQSEKPSLPPLVEEDPDSPKESNEVAEQMEHLLTVDGLPPPSTASEAPPPAPAAPVTVEAAPVTPAAPAPQPAPEPASQPEDGAKAKGKGKPPGKGASSTLAVPSAGGGAVGSSAGRPPPSPRSIATNKAIAVIGIGSGGVDELRGLLCDDMVAWALLRFEVGGGSFMRTKFVALHFNGEDVKAVQRGKLNARTKEAMAALGDVHASLEVKRCEEVDLEVLCDRLLPVFASDSGMLAGVSASQLKKEYEERMKAARQKTVTLTSPVGLTAKERPGFHVTRDQALKAVGDAKGPFNWLLLEPTKLDVHNAGFGGLEEMKNWFEDDKVMFGLIRLTFRSPLPCGSIDVPALVKHVFVHWRGPKVGAVKRGQWNAKLDDAAGQVRKVCILTLRKSVTSTEELDLKEIIDEIYRLTVLDSGGGEEKKVGISVEDYLAALAEEQEEALREAGMDTQTESEGGYIQKAFPELKSAVSTIRNGGGEDGWNYALVGLPPDE